MRRAAAATNLTGTLLREAVVTRRSVLLAIVLLAACGRDPRQALLGEWASGGSRMLFYPDGQVVMEQDSAASVARYEWLEKRRLRIRALAADPADYGVRVTRDSLELCAAAAPAQCFRLARVGDARR